MNNMSIKKHRQIAAAVGHMNNVSAEKHRQIAAAVGHMNNMSIEKHRQIETAIDIVSKRLQPIDALFHPLHEAAAQLEQNFQEIGKMNNRLARNLQQIGLAVGSIFKNADQISRIPVQLDQALKAAASLQLGSLSTVVQPAKRDAMSVNSHVYRPFINTPKGRPLLEIADSDCESILKSSDSFFWRIDQVPEVVANSGFSRAANELQEAIHDLRRVPPDCTGAMQHAGAALEAIARSISGKQNYTFGKIVNSLDLPPPMDQFASKLWGFASENGRHIREDRYVNFAMVKSSVICIFAVCEFLVESMPKQIMHTNDGDRRNRIST